MRARSVTRFTVVRSYCRCADIARRTAEAYDAAIEVVIRHFCPDTHKAGGIIAESRGIIAKINDTEQWLRLHDGTTIPFGAIRDIFSESIDL